MAEDNHNEAEQALGLTEQRKTITLSSGITFGVKSPPPLVYQRYLEKLEKELSEPEVPEVLSKTLENPEGELVKNPDDPDYQAALLERRNKFGDRLLDALIVLGLEFDLPEDNYWLEKLRFLGLDIDESPLGLKVAYVRNVAILSAEDSIAITNGVLRGVTVTEEAVAEATRKFRREAAGDAAGETLG